MSSVMLHWYFSFFAVYTMKFDQRQMLGAQTVCTIPICVSSLGHFD